MSQNTLAPTVTYRRRLWPITLLILPLPLLLAIIVIAPEFEPCRRLDVALRRSGCVRVLPGHSGIDYKSFVAYAPDGRLATQSNGVVRLWPAQEGGPLWSLPVTDRSGPLAFSPDGAWLAFPDADGAVRLKQVAPDQPPDQASPERSLTAKQGDIVALGWSGDGLLIVSAGRDNRVLVQRVGDGSLVREWHTDDSLRSAALAPDGRAVAISTDKDVSVWDVQSGQLRWRQPQDQMSMGVVFSPDSQRLAFTGPDSTVVIARASDGVQERILTVPQDEPAAQETQWEDGRTGVFTVLSSWVLAWSPDGRLVAAAGSAGWGIAVWDAASGAVRQHINPREGGQVAVSSLAFSPDSRLIAADGVMHGLRLEIPGKAVRIWHVATGDQ